MSTASEVAGMKYAAEIFLDTAALNIELCDLRQAKKTEEKKLRQEIINEYESLVKDLVMEIQVLGKRFNEFRTNTVKQVMDIITDSKTEDLMKCVEKESITEEFREKVTKDVEHEQELKTLRDENHELKMTVRLITLQTRLIAVVDQDSVHVLDERTSPEISSRQKGRNRLF